MCLVILLIHHAGRFVAKIWDVVYINATDPVIQENVNLIRKHVLRHVQSLESLVDIDVAIYVTPILSVQRINLARPPWYQAVDVDT